MKYKTLNNKIARNIVMIAASQFDVCYRAICGHSDSFTDEMLSRLFLLCNELHPFTYEVFRSLPYDVRNWYNQNYQMLYGKFS